MGVTSLVLGILALIVAWIPCIGIYALAFSVLGLILGAVGMVRSGKTGKGKGMSIAGFVCNVVATAIAIFWCMVVGGAVVAADEVGKELEKESSAISKDWDDLKKSASALSDAAKKLTAE